MNSPDPVLLAKAVRELLGGRDPIDRAERLRTEALVLTKIAIREALRHPLFGADPGDRSDAIALTKAEDEPESALEAIRARSATALSTIRRRLRKGA